MASRWGIWPGETKVHISPTTGKGYGLSCCPVTWRPYGLFCLEFLFGLDPDPVLDLADIVNECWAIPITDIRAGDSLSPKISFPGFVVWDGVLKVKALAAPNSKTTFTAIYHDNPIDNHFIFRISEFGHADYNGGEIAYYDLDENDRLVRTSGPEQFVFGEIGNVYTPFQYSWARDNDTFSAMEFTLTWPAHLDIPGASKTFKITNFTAPSYYGRGFKADGWSCGGQYTFYFGSGLPGQGYVLGYYRGDLMYPFSAFPERMSAAIWLSWIGSGFAWSQIVIGFPAVDQIGGMMDRTHWDTDEGMIAKQSYGVYPTPGPWVDYTGGLISLDLVEP